MFLKIGNREIIYSHYMLNIYQNDDKFFLGPNLLFSFSFDSGFDCCLQVDLVLYGSRLSLRLNRSPAVYSSKLELSVFPSK